MFARTCSGMGPGNAISYGLVVAYRMSVGKLLGGHCRFVPSCSAYAQDALRQKFFLTAWALIGQRLAKCHPWHPGGPDPVP